ncbi:MAG: DUF4160 domain-containing protein [bacterium]
MYMFFFDDKKHHRPHIYVNYGENDAIIAIEDGEIIEGNLPKKKLKLVQAWIEIHQEEIMADWKLAVEGQLPFKIEPLK